MLCLYRAQSHRPPKKKQKTETDGTDGAVGVVKPVNRHGELTGWCAASADESIDIDFFSCW